MAHLQESLENLRDKIFTKEGVIKNTHILFSGTFVSFLAVNTEAQPGFEKYLATFAESMKSMRPKTGRCLSPWLGMMVNRLKTKLAVIAIWDP